MKLSLIIVGAVVVAIIGFFAYSNMKSGGPAQTAAPADFVLAVVQNSVSLKNPGDADFKTVTGSVTVSEGSEIKISATGRATLLYPNGTISSLDANTDIKLATLQNGGAKSSIELVSGGIWSKLKNVLGVGDQYDVRTESVVASVRGTIFATQFLNKITTIFGIQHQVTATILDSQGNPISATTTGVQSGFKTVINQNDQHISLQPLADADLQNPLILWPMQNLLNQSDLGDPEIQAILKKMSPTSSPSPAASPKPSVSPKITPTASPTPKPTMTPTPTPVNTDPTFGYVAPTSVPNGQEFSINGTNFTTGRNVKQITEVRLNTTSVSFYIVDGQTIFATASVPAGKYDVSITTVGGKTLTLTSALTVQ